VRLAASVRVSTSKQATDGYSLPAQAHIIDTWAAQEGHEVVAVLPDVISSAKVDRLHGREAAIRLIEVGLADGLAVVRYDRATRGTLDGAQLLERSRKAGWPILTTDGRNSLVRSEMFMTDVEIAYAAEERRKIGDRTREGLAEARRQGVRLGRPPAVPEGVEALILDLHEHGTSARSIAARLNTERIPTATGSGAWTHAQVGRVLTRALAVYTSQEG